MKDKLSFPAFTHDSIAGYCNDNALYAQYKNDKKSKYIGTKQMWQELSKLRWDLDFFIEENNKSVTALIERTKELDKCQKDLGIARKALEVIKKVCDDFRWCESNIYMPDYHDGRIIAETTNEALEQIKNKE